MANRIYTAVWGWTLNAGAVKDHSFSIFSPNRELKIKSITVDHQIYDTIAQIIIPTEANTTQKIQLEINQGAAQMASTFSHSDINAPIIKGKNIWITKAGQLLFDSFYVKNELLFYLTCQNLSVNVVYNRIGLFFETEEKIIYI